jgi:hypothetical protein
MVVSMTREDIIRMAKNSGLFVELVLERDLDWLERFAKLVAQHEREACAKIADIAEPYKSADLIRARGQA